MRKQTFLTLILSLLTGIVLSTSTCQFSSQQDAATAGAERAVDRSQHPASSTVVGLPARLKAITDRAAGTVSVTVIHVETGRSASINGSAQLPLYSVFKLPLAIAVLKDVEEKKLQLNQKVYVAPSDTVPGSRTNTDLWQQPRELTIVKLIDVSIALSDNTSSEKLLELVGGPEAVTRRMSALGFDQIQIRTTIRAFIETSKNPNTGSAEDLAKLLARLQKGELLQPPLQQWLIVFMQRARTGLRRIRGNLPAGTIVGDKTGSGEINETTRTPNATNDVGLITLPDGTHLAVAVLINGSTLSDVEQEKVIADLARAAYDAFEKK